MSAENFLHKRDPNFHLSPEVMGVVSYLGDNGEQTPNQSDAKIAAYLGFLADEKYANDGILTGDRASITYQIENSIIKLEDIPESYFDLQRQIYRQQGRGNINIDKRMRKALANTIASDQKISLSQWASYLSSSEDVTYPDWFKIYAWTGVTKLADFDKEKGEFRRRSRGTTATYPDLNQEALSYVFDMIDRVHINGESLEDDALTQLVKTANFGKLYAHAMLEVMPASSEVREQTHGSWVKYDQSPSVKDRTTAKILSKSLRSHGTGWCTAGESTAAAQLSAGDFYVFYTQDKKGNDNIPRIAIRIQEGSVAEVRGINAGQQLEVNMVDIAIEKLQDLPGGEVYTRKAEDMQRLTALDKLITENPGIELSKEDIEFLFELNRDISGFGYRKDPRITEIQTATISEYTVNVLKELNAPENLVRGIQDVLILNKAYDSIMAGNPDTELDKDDIRVLYELDRKILDLRGIRDDKRFTGYKTYSLYGSFLDAQRSAISEHTVNTLKELNAPEDLVRIAQDTSRLNGIYKSVMSNPETELSANDIRFLYEIDQDMEVFETTRDPRILDAQRSAISEHTVNTLKELNAPEDLVRIAQDTSRLNGIYKSVMSNPETELSANDIRFLYEIDRKVAAFIYKTHDIYGLGLGVENNQRIKETTANRSYLADMAALFGTQKRSKDIARAMIDNGYAAHLLDNLPKLKGLDREQVFYDLVEADASELIKSHLDLFKKVDPKAIVKRVEDSQGRQAAIEVIADFASLFPVLDKATAFELLDSGHAGLVIGSFHRGYYGEDKDKITADRFPGLEMQEVADYLTGQGELKPLLKSLGFINSTYRDLPIDLTVAVNQLIEDGNFDTVVGRLRELEHTRTAIDYQDLADRLIDNEQVDYLAKNLDGFKDLDSTTANSLIMSGHTIDVMTHRSHFKSFDNGTFLLLLKQGDENYVLNNISNFRGLSSSVANELISLGNINAVLKNLSSFNLTPAVRQRLGI